MQFCWLVLKGIQCSTVLLPLHTPFGRGSSTSISEDTPVHCMWRLLTTSLQKSCV